MLNRRSRFIYLKSVFIFSLSFAIIAGVSVQAEPAEAPIEVKAEVGFKNNFEMGNMTPLHIQLTNLQSEEIRGDYVFIHSNLRGDPIVHTKEVTLPAKQSVAFTIYIQGNMDTQTTSMHFYKNGYEKGKEISLTGELKLQPRDVGGEANIAVIAKDPDTFNFILLANQSMNKHTINTIVLEPDYLIEDANSLEMFNAIVLSDVYTKDWPEKKINAIKQYVRNGGTLLMNGGASYVHTAQGFSDIAPISLNGQMTEISSIDALNQYAGLSEASVAQLPVYAGELTKGKIIASERGIPLLVKSAYGQGEVLYTAFDFSTRPFTSWEGNTNLFVSFMQKEISQPSSTNGNTTNIFEAIDYFPRLSAPPLELLLFIFFIYILLITIVLYFVLKKFSKLEWSWWIIPSVAISITMVIIVIGSLDKTKNYLHEIKIVEQYDGYINTTQRSAVFLSSTGKLEVTIPEGQRGEFLTNGGPLYTVSEDVKGEYMMEHLPQGTKLSWHKNDFWTIRSYDTYHQGKVIGEQEGIVAQVKQLEDGSYQLEVTNGTGEKLEHVTYINGQNTYKIGVLEAGETTSFKIPLPIQSASWSYFNSYQFPDVFFDYSNNAYEKYKREYTILRNTANLGLFNIIGFSYGHQSSVEVNKSRLEVDTLTMWIADITTQVSEVVNKEGFVKGELVSYNGINQWMENNYISVNTSELIFSFTIPTTYEPSSSSFVLQDNIISSDGQYHYELFDVEAQSWIPYSSKEELVQSYMDANGNIQLKLIVPNYMEMSYPNLHIKSEVRQ